MIILTPCSAYALQLHHMHAEKFPNEMREGIDPTPPPAGGSTQRNISGIVLFQTKFGLQLPFSY